MTNGTSPLRDITCELLDRIGRAELVVGIPSFNNGATIAGVVDAVVSGLAAHVPGTPAAVVVADGGSTLDATREAALEVIRGRGAAGVVGIYRGLPGKGSAVRMILAAAERLGARGVALVDADLRSITPLWVERLLGPVVSGDFAFAAPLYRRFRYDGTITNNVVYNMLRCLYGRRVRQPIGGEFGLSGELARELLAEPVWDSDVARFGIDVWLTVQALVRGLPVCQTHLGVKVHDARDPAASLEPMFRQVVGTLFQLMEQTESTWQARAASEPLPEWGEPSAEVPEAFPVDEQALVDHFYQSWRTLRGAWQAIMEPSTFAELEVHADSGPDAFLLPTDLWVRTLFEFAACHHHRRIHKQQVVEVLSPLYFARVASFVRRVRELADQDAEAVVEEQARVFELRKPYLRAVWESRPGEPERREPR